MSPMFRANPQTRDRHPARVLVLLVVLIIVASACGGDDSSDGTATSSADEDPVGTDDDTTETDDDTTETEDDTGTDGDTPTATATIGDDVYAFSGGSCFITEDGGSDGGISLSQFTGDEELESGAVSELSLDWAGDSPTGSLVRIALVDGSLIEADPLRGEEFEVSISGSTATLSATFVDVFNPGKGEMPGTVDIRC